MYLLSNNNWDSITHEATLPKLNDNDVKSYDIQAHQYTENTIHHFSSIWSETKQFPRMNIACKQHVNEQHEYNKVNWLLSLILAAVANTIYLE